VVDRASTSRFDRSAIASNTGCMFVGELAMTFKMSAVAVCRSSASLVSLKSRVFSIAIKQRDFALTGEVCLLSSQREQADAFALASGKYSAEFTPTV
jgi:hypothetical protein